jgi:hypothetical protein
MYTNDTVYDREEDRMGQREREKALPLSIEEKTIFNESA